MLDSKAFEFRNILVPVVDIQAGEHAMRLACTLLKKARGKAHLHAVYVITINRSLPVDAEIGTEVQKAEDVLDKMQICAEEESCEAETDILQSRDIGPAIVDEAVERGVDLIVMSVRPQTHFGQYTLGNIVPYVLKNAPCKVMLYQYIAPGDVIKK